MSKKVPFVAFSFAVKTKESYEEQQLLGVSFTHDSVPPGRDPVDYLRERVLAELDRVTLSCSDQRPATVVLPGYEPAEEARETE